MLSVANWEEVTLMPGFCMIEAAVSPVQDSLIALPDKAQVMQAHGCVLNMGAPARLGTDPGFGRDDHVIFARWAGAHFDTSDRRELTLVRHQDVYAVLEVG